MTAADAAAGRLEAACQLPAPIRKHYRRWTPGQPFGEFPAQSATVARFFAGGMDASRDARSAIRSSDGSSAVRAIAIEGFTWAGDPARGASGAVRGTAAKLLRWRWMMSLPPFRR